MWPGSAPLRAHPHTSRREAAARIAWCINNKAIGVVTGEVGAGGTAGGTVVLEGAVASLVSARFTVVSQPNPEVGIRGLCGRIVTSLGGTLK
ncbi:hypothetical protein ACFWOB_35010 [Streptomyces sp. NPDC058420]|uniref:hypothetical protein n=1 Tax=Streptomyces sp. NPDC058420 TaxID=3346489 RepID=UPI003653A6AF